MQSGREGTKQRVEPEQTGADLLAFLRASPLVGEDMTIERDRTPGRVVDFE